MSYPDQSCTFLNASLSRGLLQSVGCVHTCTCLYYNTHQTMRRGQNVARDDPQPHAKAHLAGGLTWFEVDDLDIGEAELVQFLT